MSERELILALVRSAARPGPERATDVRRHATGRRVEELLAVLGDQRLTAALGGRLLDDPSIELPPPLAGRVEVARAAARRRGLLHLAATRRVAATLAERGIPALPLKGAVLADAVYGDAGARVATDIDLLVPVGDLEAAVAAAVDLGWSEPPAWTAPRGLPRLHRELEHPSLPPLELHWRVHWYEDRFAQAALDRSVAVDGEPWRRAVPADELAFLLLFLARDGFAGLRQTVDVAAWWAACGSAGAGEDVRAIADAHPELRAPLAAAAHHAERTAGIPRGALFAPPRPLSHRPRLALRLANPWLEGSPAQIDAEQSLVDGLLAPRGGLRAFVTRQLLQPDHVLLRRDPHLLGAPPGRMRRARLAHALRVLRRYAVAAPRLLRPQR